MPKVKLSDIRTDGGTQMRAELKQDTYLEYRDLYKDGVDVADVDLFHDGSVYWLADGFHRFYGAREAKKPTINATVHQGTQRDAILFAAGANARHGLRRSNADKRKAVETLLNDPEWVKWSDNKIAEKASVSQEFVRQRRAQLTTVVSSPAAKQADKPRVGRDGKARKPPAKTSAVSDYFDSRPENGKPAPKKREKVERADADMPEAYVDDRGVEVPKSLFPVWQAIDEFAQIREQCRQLSGSIRHLGRTKAGRAIAEAANLVEEAEDEIRRAKPLRVNGKDFLTVGEVEDE